MLDPKSANEHKRREVGYRGISFENWVKVKFEEIRLNIKDEMQYRNEWARANFLREDHVGLTPYIAPTVWDKSSAIWDK
jgi:hypothetical protein